MMKWRTGPLVCLVLAACSPDAPTGVATPDSPASVIMPPKGEQLLAEPPSHWQQSFRSDAGGIRLVEYLPPDTDPGNWTDKISFESFIGDPLPDPVDLMTSIEADQRSACEGFEVHQTFSGSENGYPTAVSLFVCYLNKLAKQGQVTMVKTIKGDENFYVVTRARRVAPIQRDAEAGMPPQAIAEWSLYLRAISVCNPTDAAHPCPDPAADAAATAPTPGSE
jgi:hypothetical protein